MVSCSLYRLEDVLVRVTINVINTMAKSKLERKGFKWTYTSTLLFITEDRNLNAEADAEAM